MKKLFVHLSLLCLLAALAVPMVGCHKEEAEVEESTTTAMEEPAVATTEPMGTDMGTTEPMGTDMGGTTEPMGTEMTPPPAQ
jgi:actin-like ATPase involved in cell morphogenesis